MDKDKTEEDSKDYKGILITFGVVCAAVAMVIYGAYLLARAGDEARRLDAINYWKYISDHQCVRTGFAGKNATPTYQCDNGLWLGSEIDSLANPKESK